MKHFLVILALVAMVWLGITMAEQDSYPLTVKVEMVGYDTVRYSVVSRDSLLPLTVRMSGFDALIHSLRPNNSVLRVDMGDGHEAVAVAMLEDQLMHCILGAKQVESEMDSLHLVLAERSCRSYVPRIDDVNFSFDEQYGLYGEPRIVPGEVVLYGPAEVLASIPEVKVAAADLHGIKASGSYRLPLEPVWLHYADVHPSCSYVDVYLPVEAYVEHTFRVPITVLDADTTVSLKLYPEEVSIRAWVAQRDLHRKPDFVVAVNYADVFLHDGRLTPQLMEFPSYVRPRNVEPSEIQCVVFK